MVPVVFSSDHNFIMPTGVAIKSMLESAPNVQFDIYILQNDDVTDNDRNLLCKITDKFDAKISFISIGTEFSQSYVIRDITISSYYRLLIPWLITDYDWIIYLDGDIIVKSDISKILDYITDSNCLVYGVRTPGFNTDIGAMKYIRSIGLDPHKYINGGILVLNAKLLRDGNYKEKFLSYEAIALYYQDQDIINLVCKDRIGWLPIKFNRTPSLESYDKNALVKTGIMTYTDLEEACSNPVVIHYIGMKPWITYTYHWYDWWDVYSRSRFYNSNFEYELSTKILKPNYSIKQLLKMIIKKVLNR